MRYRMTLGLALAWLACGALAGAQVPELAPENAPSTGEVASSSEPGRRLVIAGRVVDAGTKAPVAGASLYIYQTDATGYYTTDGTNNNRNPRLRLHLRAGPAGEFEARTIRPAPYPQGGVPAHVHFVVLAPGYTRRVFEIVFDDDPLVGAEIRRRAEEPASMFAIVKTPAGGPARVDHDVKLYPRN